MCSYLLTRCMVICAWIRCHTTLSSSNTLRAVPTCKATPHLVSQQDRFAYHLFLPHTAQPNTFKLNKWSYHISKTSATMHLFPSWCNPFSINHQTLPLLRHCCIFFCHNNNCLEAYKSCRPTRIVQLAAVNLILTDSTCDVRSNIRCGITDCENIDFSKLLLRDCFNDP